MRDEYDLEALEVKRRGIPDASDDPRGVRSIAIQGDEPWRQAMEVLRELPEGEWVLMRVETQAKDRESVRSGLKQAGYRRLAHTGHSFNVRIPEPPQDGKVELFICKTRRKDAPSPEEEGEQE